MAGSGFFRGTTSPANTRITAATSAPSITRTMVDTARSLEVEHTATGTPLAGLGFGGGRGGVWGGVWFGAGRGGEGLVFGTGAGRGGEGFWCGAGAGGGGVLEGRGRGLGGRELHRGAGVAQGGRAGGRVRSARRARLTSLRRNGTRARAWGRRKRQPAAVQTAPAPRPGPPVRRPARAKAPLYPPPPPKKTGCPPAAIASLTSRSTPGRSGIAPVSTSRMKRSVFKRWRSLTRFDRAAGSVVLRKGSRSETSWRRLRLGGGGAFGRLAGSTKRGETKASWRENRENED